MIISNYYRGGTNRITGFTVDTEKKIYKKFVIKESQWKEKTDDVYHDPPKIQGFKMPGPMEYYFPTKTDMEIKLTQYENLGFIENKFMTLDFGIFKL
jgi:hypothetical protein